MEAHCYDSIKKSRKSNSKYCNSFLVSALYHISNKWYSSCYIYHLHLKLRRKKYSKFKWIGICMGVWSKQWGAHYLWLYPYLFFTFNFYFIPDNKGAHQTKTDQCLSHFTGEHRFTKEVILNCIILGSCFYYGALL